MKANIYAAALTALVATSLVCESSTDSTTKQRQSQSKPNHNQMTYEQKKEEDHRQVCNILGFASNIFSNFVQLVSAPNSRENVGQQVGNMAENVFHIVSEATKSVIVYKSGKTESDVLDYLQSEQFKKDLTEIIVKQLDAIKS